MSDLRLPIAPNSWGIIDSALPISMLLFLAWGLIVFVSTKLHQHKKLVYYFWGRFGITVDCSKGIFFETVVFHCFKIGERHCTNLKLIRCKPLVWISPTPPTKTCRSPRPNYIDVWRFCSSETDSQTLRFHPTLRPWYSILFSTSWL